MQIRSKNLKPVLNYGKSSMLVGCGYKDELKYRLPHPKSIERLLVLMFILGN